VSTLMDEGIPAFVPPRGQPNAGVMIDKEFVTVQQQQVDAPWRSDSPCELVYDEGRVMWMCGKTHTHRT
jgi:hypothetical protein